jgi:hypothetical protein
LQTLKTQTKFNSSYPGYGLWMAVASNHVTGEYRVLGTVYKDAQDVPQPECPAHPDHQPVTITKDEEPFAATLALVEDHPALPQGPEWGLELYSSQGWFTEPQ